MKVVCENVTIFQHHASVEFRLPEGRVQKPFVTCLALEIPTDDAELWEPGATYCLSIFKVD